MHDKITQIMKNAHLFDARDFARQLFQIASFDRFFAFTKDPAMLPKSILFRVSGADQYADLCHKAIDECITLLKQQSFRNRLLSEMKPNFLDKILCMLNPESDPKKALLLLSAGKDDFHPQLLDDCILRRLWDLLPRTNEACRTWNKELHLLRDELEAQTMELTKPFARAPQKLREAIARFVADYATWTKGMVMLNLLDFGQSCLESILNALVAEAKCIANASSQEKYKLHPDGEARPISEARIPIKYRPCSDGLHIYAGSLPGSGFVGASNGVTLPYEINGIRITEFSGTYQHSEIEHIEAFGLKRVSLTIRGDSDMLCKPPALFGNIQNTIEEMSLVFDAPSMQLGSFENRKDLKSIAFTGTVLETADWDYGHFEEDAFQNCTNLIHVDGVFKGHTLAHSTFENCTSLQSAPTMEVKAIAPRAFLNCASLATLTLPNTLERIGYAAFAKCSALRDLFIPDTCTTIEASAFSECTSLISVHLPATLSTIYDGLFSGCTSLKKVFLSDAITSIGSYAFADCCALERPWIPESIKKIGTHAFYGCSSVKEVTIPEGIEEIGEQAFGQIPGLIIRGYAGTAAEKYAQENNITFVALSPASETDETDLAYDLSRFTTMHQADFATALAEIKNGRKVSHWIWYIFPMLRGRRGGHNNTTYGIADIGEARAFLADPYLGDNFITICEAILALPSNDIHYILGSSDVDVEKFCASMTLFMLAAKDNPLFSRILDKYYAGKPDEKTLKMLNIL